KYSLLATAGVLILTFVLTAIGPKRVLAALGYTPVRDVDKRQPYQASVQTDLPAGTLTRGFDVPAVPSGKRLVIEYITFDASASNGEEFEAQVWSSAAAATAIRANIPLSYQAVIFGSYDYAGSEKVLMFTEAGDHPVLVVARGSAAAS